MRKLIIIRGNSGSGKSTAAKQLREMAKRTNKVALVEQDYLRRIVLKEKESDCANNVDLIEQTVTFALTRNYDVILEGILYSGRYRPMIEKLTGIASETYMFYLDVSLEESLKRHASKPNAHEFGENEMRRWYKKHDVLGTDDETIIPESYSLAETVAAIGRMTKI